MASLLSDLTAAANEGQEDLDVFQKGVEANKVAAENLLSIGQTSGKVPLHAPLHAHPNQSTCCSVRYSCHRTFCLQSSLIMGGANLSMLAHKCNMYTKYSIAV